MTESEFLTLLILGAASGALFALNALGLLVVFRSSGVVNFASGGIGMAGAFLYYELTYNLGLSKWPSVLIAVAFAALLGLISYVVVMKPLHSGSNLTRVIATVGVLLVLQAVAELRYGDSVYQIPSFIPSRTITFWSISVGEDRLWLLGITLILSVGLAELYRRTRFGIATTAVAENPRGLASLGHRLDLVRSVNWAIGGALAALATIFLVPITGLSVSLGTSLLVSSLAAALFGNLSSFGLTFIGGLIIGILQTELAPYSGTITGLADAVPFVFIVVILVIRGKLLPLRSYINERLPRVGTGTLRPKTLLVGTAAFGLFLWFATSTNWQYAITVSLIEAMLLLSMTVVTGYAGQVSFAQASLAGISAMCATQLLSRWTLPYGLVFVVAVVAALPVGLIVGLPSLRTRGTSLAIATLGMAVAIQALVFSNATLTDNGFGVDITHGGKRALEFFGFDVDPINYPKRFAILVLVVLLILCVAVTNLRRGQTGLRFIAVRNNERGATALGLSVASVKLYAFVIAAGIAGVAGVFLAWQSASVQFQTYGTTQNLDVVAFAVIGGVGTVVGAVVGGLLAAGGIGQLLLQDISSSWSSYLGLISGVLLVINVVSSPDGVTGPPIAFLRRLTASLHTRARARRAAQPEDDRAAEVSDSAEARPSLALSLDRPKLPAGVLLQVAGLSVSFGGIKALIDVTFAASAGEVLAIIGPNGAGKTTLIDAITGFVPASGEMSLAGRRIDNLSAFRRARMGLGRSFQSLELFEELSVLDNLRVAADEHHLHVYLRDLVRPRKLKQADDFAALLGTLGLADAADLRTKDLAYGRRRLLAVGRALVAAPNVLMLDEPCAGLDPNERAKFAVFVRDIADSLGIAVILVEHDVDLVSAVADRVLALDFGREIASGTPDEVLSDARVLTAYLGIPVEESSAQTAPGHEPGTSEAHKTDQMPKVGEKSQATAGDKL
jgi:ABC-type branched-subunit amino acid transport system ATPase component/branched-subunit amino acid ABC-type transport system permease component